jgi:hypothetical protein
MKNKIKIDTSLYHHPLGENIQINIVKTLKGTWSIRPPLFISFTFMLMQEWTLKGTICMVCMWDFQTWNNINGMLFYFIFLLALWFGTLCLMIKNSLSFASVLCQHGTFHNVHSLNNNWIKLHAKMLSLNYFP